MPLVMPVQLVVNASETLIDKHIRHNSRNDTIEWLTESAAHETPALVCGNGPSLADSLDDIKERHALGAHIFALNGAANFLYEHGITADYQVLVDSRERTLDLIGPAHNYLFSVQVHPRAFKMCPNAKLFLMAYENIDELVPDARKRDHVLVGGGGSVGNCAAVIVNVMGYRDLHFYGYDSSSKPDGTSHAQHQKMNDGEAMCVVKFDGKEYQCSLTMAYQADRFMQIAAALQAADCKVEVHGYGLLPDRFNATPEAIEEAEKYRRMWEYEAYRVTSPGETCVETFLEHAKPAKGATITDFGTGSGKAAVKLKEAGLVVTTTDFADNCRDVAAIHMLFHLHDLREPMPWKTQYGYCCDVMEHIPPDDVETVVSNIMNAAPTTFFQICHQPDAMGVLIEQPLHLTVKPYSWWKELFERLGCEVVWDEYDVVSSQFLIHKKGEV